MLRDRKMNVKINRRDIRDSGKTGTNVQGRDMHRKEGTGI